MNKILLVTMTMVAAGCGGIPKEKYDATLAELAKSKEALIDAQNAQKKCDAHASDLEKRDTADEAQLAVLREKQRLAEQRAQQYRDLTAKFKSMIDAGKLQVQLRDGLMLVKLSENVLFDPGKTDLKPAGKEALKEVSTILATIADRKFQVAGHTDDAPLGKGSKFVDNWGLSSARALEVLHFMINEGKMPPARLSASGWADQLPVAKNDSNEGRAQNRRIEIILLPNLEDLPPMADKK